MARLKKIKFADGGRTVILKPDVRKEQGYFAKWKRHVWKILIPAIVVLVVVIYNVFVRAEILNYYPASCLGNWENVVNAVGAPQLAAGASANQFTPQNSAHYSGSDGQIFCGNFASGGDPVNKVFKQATVHFVWSVVSDGQSSSSAQIVVPLPDVNAAASSSAGSSSTPADQSVSPPAAASSSTDTPSPDVPAQLPPDPVPTPESSPTTLLRYFAPLAFADSSIATNTMLSDGGQSSTNLLASGTMSTPSSTLLIPFDFAPAASSATVITQGGDMLLVSYSLDGKNWITVGSVNGTNWQNALYNLPLHSWDELKQLQVSIQGLPGGESSGGAYLDGMEVDVQYAPADLFGDIFTPSASGTAVVPSSSDRPASQPVVFDEMAKERCEVQPFSLRIKSGGAASGVVTLHPSNGSSTAALRLGDLPPGITVDLSRDPDKPNRFILNANASPEAQTGSLSLNIIYTETEPNHFISNTFCQYNLVVID